MFGKYGDVCLYTSNLRPSTKPNGQLSGLFQASQGPSKPLCIQHRRQSIFSHVNHEREMRSIDSGELYDSMNGFPVSFCCGLERQNFLTPFAACSLHEPSRDMAEHGYWLDRIMQVWLGPDLDQGHATLLHHVSTGRVVLDCDADNALRLYVIITGSSLDSRYVNT